jgi:hypothetical protein
MAITLVLWNDENASDIMNEFGAQSVTDGVWAIPDSTEPQFRRRWQEPYAVPNDIMVLRVTGIEKIRQPFMNQTTPNYLREAFPQAADYKFNGSP